MTREELLKNGWEEVDGYTVLMNPTGTMAIGESWGFWYVVDFDERTITPHRSLWEAYNYGSEYGYKRNLRRKTIDCLISDLLYNNVFTKKDLQQLKYDGNVFTY